MSLTEEQKTAKNFHEFYSMIRPYLNGSYPTPIVNKFSKGDLYSTEEKIIGQWIDGKPLYQKVITGLSVSLTNNDWTSLGTVASNTEAIIGCTLILGNSHIIYANETQIVNNTSVRVQATIGGSRTVTGIIVAYTKTTDSPISIGDGNDYSTDEQVVGTWIDEKPIYQKTLQASVTLADEWAGNIAVSDLSIDTLIDTMGTVISPYKISTQLNGRLNSGNLNVYVVGLGGLVTNTITIKYTKTTD